MRWTRLWPVGIIALYLLSLSTANAQSGQEIGGVIQGKVFEPESERPVAAATVVIAGAGLSATSDASGVYRIEGIPPGQYRVIVVGYATLEPTTTSVEAGQIITLNLPVSDSAGAGEVIVVTGTRVAEKVLDAPVSVHALHDREIARIGGGSFLSAAAELPGVHFNSVGLLNPQVSARGFHEHTHTRMLWLIDGRLAQNVVGFPAANLLPTTSLDVKSVEVVVGPSSALYGPNAHTGVLNVRTKTPWDESGASLSVRGGTQSRLDGTARLAGTVRDRLGWKIHAQYLRGNDFEPDRDHPAYRYGTSIAENDLIGDYRVRMAKGEGSLYYRLGDWSATASYGISHLEDFGVSSFARVGQEQTWQFGSVQLTHPHWYAQVSRISYEGKAFDFRRLAAIAEERVQNGEPITESDLAPIREDLTSTVPALEMLDSEVQYRNEVGGVKAISGVQVRRHDGGDNPFQFDPKNGELEPRTELGGYLQLDYQPWPDHIRLVGAARIDNHSDYSTQISPKVAAVYSPTPAHKLRVGYSRAFKSPTLGQNYLFALDTLIGNRYGWSIRDGDGNILFDIPPLRPEEVHSVELGYKGKVSNAVFLDVLFYNSWYEDFISPLSQVADPMNGTFAYDSDGMLLNGDDPALAGRLSTYVNFGRATVGGTDIGVNIYPTDYITVSTAVSWISMADFSRGDLGVDLHLNVPELKLMGSVMVQDLGIDNYFVRMSGRYRSAYEFESGYWSSEQFYDDGKLPGRFVADLAVGYRLPGYGLTMQGYVLNIFDNSELDVLGAAVAKRFTYVQVSYRYRGL